MTDIACVLEAEHDRLTRALRESEEHWGKVDLRQDILTLAEAVDHAERLLAAFEAEEAAQSPAFTVRVGGLRALLLIGRTELKHAGRCTLEVEHRGIAEEERESPGLETVIAQGTILSCPRCGEGLYKVMTRARIEDLMLDEGTILRPLNLTIPQRDVWKMLACPHCGGGVYRAGKVHTVHGGWQ
jgi:uncharacterized C2H2 Zn-finger protein